MSSNHKTRCGAWKAVLARIRWFRTTTAQRRLQPAYITCSCTVLAFLLAFAPADAQERSLSGTVTTEAGAALANVTVIVQGTSVGTVTDAQGRYILEVPTSSDTLMFSLLGYATRTVAVDGRAQIDAVLVSQAVQLEGLVVTALGVRREERALGYSVQTVKPEALVTVPKTNVAEALTGRVAGLRISNAPNLFNNPTIRLRGKQPLIVLDGVPIESDSWNFAAYDIESVNVLKGPTAAALYGSRGINGAIQITTRRGSSDGRPLSFEVSSGAQLEGGYIAIPEVQHEYGPGSYGLYAYGDDPLGLTGINSVDYLIWGPKFEGQLVPQYDSPIDPETGKRLGTPWLARGRNNLTNYLEPGLLTTNNFSIASIRDGQHFRASVSQSHQKGQVPNTGVDILNVNLSGGTELTDRLSAETYVNYSRQRSDNFPNLDYGPRSLVYLLLIWNASHFDVRDLRDYWMPGQEGIQPRSVENTIYNNPYFVAYEQTRGYYKDDVKGYVRLDYEFSPALRAEIGSTIDFYYLNRQNRYPVGTTEYDPWRYVGGYEELFDNFQEHNTHFLLTYNGTVGEDVTVQAMAGGNYRFFETRYQYGSTQGGLIVPGLYTLGNSVEPVSPTTEKSAKQVLSGYGSIDLGFRDYLFLGLTGRWDKSSALPTARNSYFYPSLSASAVISDMVSLPSFVDLFKVRASYAKVGSDLDLYSYSPRYEQGDRWGSVTSLSYANTLYDPASIEPPFSSSFEGGVDLRFLGGRLGLSVTRFLTTDGPQVFALPVSETSGFTARQVSGRKFERRGWEVTLDTEWLRTQDFRWSTQLNWSTLREYLKELYGDEQQLNYIQVGERTDQYWATVLERSPDGQVVYGANGYPRHDPYERFIGNWRPDWSAGLTSDMTYKDFRLSFTFAGSYGGLFWNQLERYLWDGGRHPNSITPEREDEVNGIKSMVGPGVVVTSGEITYDGEGNVVSDTREFAPNTTPVFYSDWVRRYWTTEELMVMDRTFFKLRDAALTYRVPQSFAQRFGVSSAELSLVGRNLLYFAGNKNVDLDEYEDGDTSSDLQTPTARSIGVNLKLRF